VIYESIIPEKYVGALFSSPNESIMIHWNHSESLLPHRPSFSDKVSTSWVVLDMYSWNTAHFTLKNSHSIICESLFRNFLPYVIYIIPSVQNNHIDYLYTMINRLKNEISLVQIHLFWCFILKNTLYKYKHLFIYFYRQNAAPAPQQPAVQQMPQINTGIDISHILSILIPLNFSPIYNHHSG
jgi:hypothetical protein